jgi:hypothetical protein
MSHTSARLICILLLSGLALPNASAAEYSLMPSPQTVHVGYFSAMLKPVLTVNSGDIVTIESVAGLDPVTPATAFEGKTARGNLAWWWLRVRGRHGP